MSAIKGLEWTFDAVASTYEKLHPGYPDELYKMILDYIALNESCRGGDWRWSSYISYFLDNTYDLVYSASAFHWVPENIGYMKVFSMLKSGGAFVRFANHPYRDKDNLSLSEEMDKIYAAYYYKFCNKKQEVPTEYSEEHILTISQLRKVQERNFSRRLRMQ